MRVEKLHHGRTQGFLSIDEELMDRLSRAHPRVMVANDVALLFVENSVMNAGDLPEELREHTARAYNLGCDYLILHL